MQKPVTISFLGLMAGLALPALGGSADGQMVDVGGHRLFVQCSGGPSDTTVVLENGLGAGLEAWEAVQAGVQEFSRVCSYDRAGEGRSDKPRRPQTPESVVDDLHKLLASIKAPGPYVLVGASLGGVFVRTFAERYADQTAAIVLVDSSHEEQYGRYFAISPAIAERFATQDGRFDRAQQLRATGQLEPGKRLEWHLDVPLIVLEHKRLSGEPRTDMDRLAVVWHELQVDLAGRSKYGRLIETKSGHFMAGEQPEVVVEAIRDAIRQARGLRAVGR